MPPRPRHSRISSCGKCLAISAGGGGGWSTFVPCAPSSPVASVWVATPTPSTQRGQSPCGESGGSVVPQRGQVPAGFGGGELGERTGGIAGGEFRRFTICQSAHSTNPMTPAVTSSITQRISRSTISPPPILKSPSIALSIYPFLLETRRKVTSGSLHAL